MLLDVHVDHHTYTKYTSTHFSGVVYFALECHEISHRRGSVGGPQTSELFQDILICQLFLFLPTESLC